MSLTPYLKDGLSPKVHIPIFRFLSLVHHPLSELIRQHGDWVEAEGVEA
jgi:hypothetical protein